MNLSIRKNHLTHSSASLISHSFLPSWSMAELYGRAFAHGAMSHWINPTWWTYELLFIRGALNYWYNKGCGMNYHICGMMHIYMCVCVLNWNDFSELSKYLLTFVCHFFQKFEFRDSGKWVNGNNFSELTKYFITFPCHIFQTFELRDSGKWVWIEKTSQN